MGSSGGLLAIIVSGITLVVIVHILLGHASAVSSVSGQSVSSYGQVASAFRQ